MISFIEQDAVLDESFDYAEHHTNSRELLQRPLMSIRTERRFKSKTESASATIVSSANQTMIFHSYYREKWLEETKHTETSAALPLMCICRPVRHLPNQQPKLEVLQKTADICTKSEEAPWHLQAVATLLYSLTNVQELSLNSSADSPSCRSAEAQSHCL